MKKSAITLMIGLLVMEFWGIAFAQSKDEALSLFKKGEDASNQGSYEEALKYYGGALKINRQLKVPEDIARTSAASVWLTYLSIVMMRPSNLWRRPWRSMSN